MSDVQLGAGEKTGKVAHDSPDAGNPRSKGLNAVAFGSDPPQVSADGDRVRAIATPQGIQWVLGGYPDLVTREYVATGAQTNDVLIALAAGATGIVTQIQVVADNANTLSPSIRVGFALATLPTEPTDGNSATGIVLSHPGLSPGSSYSVGEGIGATIIGAANEDLRITCTDPGGKIRVLTSFYFRFVI